MEQHATQSNGGQKLAAVLIGTLGSGLLFSASLAVPIIGFVSAFLAPVPLGLARIKGGSIIAGLLLKSGAMDFVLNRTRSKQEWEH